jgi:hypothetical protein
VVGIGVEAPVARCLLGRLGDVIDDEGDEFQGISRLVLNSRQGASKMAAIDIYDVMPDFITGKRKDEKGRGITNWTNIGADRSANINAGQAVNEAFYSWHHQRSQVPKVLKAIHGWAELSTCQNEQNSCFIYGDWNHRCYRAFLVFARLAGDAELERKLVAHNRNMMIVLALSATHQRRETRQSTGVQTVCCGHRSWIADRPGKSKSYTDSSGRYLPASNLDYSGLDGHLNEELGLGVARKGYGKLVKALDTLGVPRSCLSADEREILREVVMLQSPPTSAQRERLSHIVSLLQDGPFVNNPIDILKTTRGVAFVLRKGKGGSTCSLPVKIWFADRADSVGPWNDMAWWDIDPQFGWLSTDPPRRRAGRSCTAEIHAVEGGYEIHARSSAASHYDCKLKKDVSGDTVGFLPGELVYHLQWSPSETTISFSGDGGRTTPPPDGGERREGKTGKRFPIRWFVDPQRGLMIDSPELQEPLTVEEAVALAEEGDPKMIHLCLQLWLEIRQEEKPEEAVEMPPRLVAWADQAIEKLAEGFLIGQTADEALGLKAPGRDRGGVAENPPNSNIRKWLEEWLRSVEGSE